VEGGGDVATVRWKLRQMIYIARTSTVLFLGLVSAFLSPLAIYDRHVHVVAR